MIRVPCRYVSAGRAFPYMSMLEWDPVASYHDILFQQRTFDIPFWVALARKFGSPVLELACGTGRLTFPMAQAGVQITGVDISLPMLRIAKEKRKSYAASIQRRIEFVLGDATDFSFAQKKFTAVLLPWGFIPVTHEEQEGLFRSVHNALSSSGHIVIDIENCVEPQYDWNTVRAKEYVRLPKQGATLFRTAYNSGSAETKVGRIVYTLDIIRKNGAMKRLITQRIYKIYTVRDLKQLLVSHGFRIVRVYGDYDFSPWTPDSPQALIVAKRSTGGVFTEVRNRISAYLK